jgi:two-component system cell cycle response regulator DivK
VSETIAPARHCILVVEDNPANMMLVVAVLERAGFRIAQASSAEAARRLIETVSPDLILMDIQLPGEDGLSLTRELKTNPTTTHIPIIVLTAHAMKGDEVQAIAAGCDAYVAKPIDTHKFATFITQFLPRQAKTVK